MGEIRVAGVALVHDDGRGPRVLAARRAAPSALAGGWEFPGGKCEPGESLEQAAVREVDEELGCRVRVTGRLAGVQVIERATGQDMVLEVVVAELVDGEPVPREREHDAVRWLGRDELEAVAWLPADVPFLEELARHLEEHR